VAESNYKNREERVSTVLPVHFGFASGITHNVSASGCFFETNLPLNLGSFIDFSLEINPPTGKMELRCTGEVVRIKRVNYEFNIAVKIHESAMVRIEI
jgi:PilZ domain